MLRFNYWLWFQWRPFLRKLVKMPPDEALHVIRVNRGRTQFHHPESGYKDAIIESLNYMEKLIEENNNN